MAGPADGVFGQRASQPPLVENFDSLFRAWRLKAISPAFSRDLPAKVCCQPEGSSRSRLHWSGVSPGPGPSPATWESPSWAVVTFSPRSWMQGGRGGVRMCRSGLTGECIGRMAGMDAGISDAMIEKSVLSGYGCRAGLGASSRWGFGTTPEGGVEAICMHIGGLSIRGRRKNCAEVRR